MKTSFMELVKIGLAASGAVAALLAYVLARVWKSEEAGALANDKGFVKIWRYRFSARQVAVTLLLTFGVVCVLNAYKFSWESMFEDYDEYDILHYYLNAKYSDELGYDLLYPAVIIADHETVQRFEGRLDKYRETSRHEYRPLRHALTLRKEIKTRFSESRWEDFKHDYEYLQKRVGIGTWRTLLQDRGYNATPIGNMICRALANAVAIEDLKLVCMVDMLLFVAMFAVVFWAFGPEALAFGLIFMGVSYSLRWPVVGYSVMRYDWVVAMVAAAGFVKKGRYKTAGALFGYATCIRIFPAVFLFGLLVKGLHGFIKHVRADDKHAPEGTWMGIPRDYFRMAGAMVLTMAILSGIALAREGSQMFVDNAEDLRVHMLPENLSSQRCGLGTALVFDNTTGTRKGYIPKEKKLEVGEKAGLKYAIAIVILILLGLGMTRLEDHEAILLGFIPFFLLQIASYYYYVMRMTVIVGHASRLDKGYNALALFLLLGIEVVTWTAELTTRARYFAVGWMGWTLALYCVVVTGVLFQRWWVERRG